jgi:hypothetical protein
VIFITGFTQRDTNKYLILLYKKLNIITAHIRKVINFILIPFLILVFKFLNHAALLIFETTLIINKGSCAESISQNQL